MDDFIDIIIIIFNLKIFTNDQNHKFYLNVYKFINSFHILNDL